MSVHKSRKLAMAETREALIQAGLAEFAERGFDAPSLDKICARAGFTRGAFYVHFENREDFLVAVMESRLGAFLRRGHRNRRHRDGPRAHGEPVRRSPSSPSTQTRGRDGCRRDG